MKTIVVCLDGTNQTKAQVHPTNISKIFDVLGGNVVDGDHGSFETTVAAPDQILGKYLPGVGTQGDIALKVLGNLFGDGIAEPIVRGYTFLSRSYSPGDQIFITGFSRGATAARALAGFVVEHGLLDSSKYDAANKNAAYLRAIAAWYAYRHSKPDFASQARLVVIEGLLGQGFGLPKLEPDAFTTPLPIKAVGVFDTVSSLGVPHLDQHGDASFDFSICSTDLSPNVQYGFHALAADEMRELFGPTFWADRKNITQQIFPGCHSDVGGGYPNSGLSDTVLVWMLEQFKGVGLPLDWGHLQLKPDPCAIAQDDGATFPFNRTPRRARGFPETVRLSDSIQARWSRPVEMLPSTTLEAYKAKGTYADGHPLK